MRSERVAPGSEPIDNGAQRNPGSFRDPRGCTYVKGQRIFRVLTRRGVDDFAAVEATGLFDELLRRDWLVRWWPADDVDLGPDAEPAERVLEHEPLDFVSYPYEWSFAGLKAAALLHLDVQLLALEHGVTLSDSTAYNIQFRGAKPVFIDHLSFRPYREGEFWLGHRQFCAEFLNPLLLRSHAGLPFHDWYRGAMDGISATMAAKILPWRARLSPRVLAHVILPARVESGVRGLTNARVSRATKNATLPRRSFDGMLRSLRGWISRLEPAGRGRTAWSEYASRNSYTSEEEQKKRAFVTRFTERLRPRCLWDIGCNTGGYAKLALDRGASRVIGFENDPGALEAAFLRSAAEGLEFLPLYLDAANPSPAQGWRQSERAGLSERRNADGILALAILHHLCIGRNVPLNEAVAWLVGLAPHGVIEFVPKSDPMVRELLALREDVYDDYTDAAFDQALSAECRVVESEELTAGGGRRLIWYERRGG